ALTVHARRGLGGKRGPRTGRRVGVASSSGVGSANGPIVVDDAADGNDAAGPAWRHLDGAVRSTGQAGEAEGGGYRLQAPSSSPHRELAGYGFVGSRVEPLYTDVRVTADFVQFQTGSLAGWFGVAARLNGNNAAPVSGTGIGLQGYSY